MLIILIICLAFVPSLDGDGSTTLPSYDEYIRLYKLLLASRNSRLNTTIGKTPISTTSTTTVSNEIKGKWVTITFIIFSKKNNNLSF